MTSVLAWKRVTGKRAARQRPEQGARLFIGFERAGRDEGGEFGLVLAYNATRWAQAGDVDLGEQAAVRLSLSTKGDRLFAIRQTGEVVAFDAVTVPIAAGSAGR